MDEKTGCFFVLYRGKDRKKEKAVTKHKDFLSELKKVKALLDAEVITEEEFTAIKAKLIEGL